MGCTQFRLAPPCFGVRSNQSCAVEAPAQHTWTANQPTTSMQTPQKNSSLLGYYLCRCVSIYWRFEEANFFFLRSRALLPLKVKTIQFQTSHAIYPKSNRNILADLNHQQHRCEDLKSSQTKLSLARRAEDISVCDLRRVRKVAKMRPYVRK